MTEKRPALTVQKNLQEARAGLAGTLITCALFSFGQAFLFTPAFESVTLSPWVIALCGFLMCGAFGLMIRFRGKRWVLPACVGILLLLTAILALKLIDGIALLFNDVMELLCRRTGRIFLSVTVGEKATASYAVLFFTGLDSLLIACAAVFCEPVLILPLMAVSFAGCIGGLLPCNSGLAALVCGTAFLLICRNQRYEKIRIRTAALPLAVLTLCTCAVCITGARASFSAQPLRTRITEAIHAHRFHEGEPALPEGKLTAAIPSPAPDTPALTVTFSKPEKTYLRGFIGEEYTGSGWRTLPGEEISQAKDLFYTLHKNGFTGATILAEANRAAGNSETETVDITVVNACARYLYLPYGTADGELLDPMVIGDAKFHTTEKNHVYAYYPGATADWFALLSDIAMRQEEAGIAAYLSKESAYRLYAKEHYLQLTEKAETTLSHVFSGNVKPDSFAEIKTALFEALDAYMQYNENAPAPQVPAGGDYLTALLEQQTGGGSIQYATAAALMLRYLGLPARYVEGYLISAEDAATIKPGEAYTVTAAQAHAWAEYYIDGVGWLPLEVTPGVSGDGNEPSERTEDDTDNDSEEETERESYVSEELQQYIEEYRQQNVTSPEPVQPEKSGSRTLLWLLLLPLLLLAAWFLRARLLLRKKQNKIKNAPDREAVLLEYAWAEALISKGAAPTAQAAEAAKQLNEEAFFSDHPIGDSHRRRMRAYRQAVLQTGISRWKLPKQLYLRFIKGLY